MPSLSGFQLLDYDRATGVKTLARYDDVTEEMTIGSVQDVNPILEQAAASRNDPSQPWRREGGGEMGWWKVASIPLVLVEKWKREDGIDVFNKDHTDAVVKKLNDPDYAYLKTAPITI